MYEKVIMIILIANDFSFNKKNIRKNLQKTEN